MLYVGTKRPAGNQFVGRVERFDPTTGTDLGPFIQDQDGPFRCLAFGPDGDLYAGVNSFDINRYDGATGAFKGVFVPAHSGGLYAPNYLLFSDVPEPHLGLLNAGAVGALLVRKRGPARLSHRAFTH